MLLKRRSDIIAPHQRELDWLLWRFTDALREYASAFVTYKTQSVKLAWGTLAFKNNPPSLVIDDDQPVLAWARSHDPSAIKETIINSPVKQRLLSHSVVVRMATNDAREAIEESVVVNEAGEVLPTDSIPQGCHIRQADRFEIHTEED